MARLRFAEEAVRPATAEMRCGDGASILRATIPRRPCGGACSSMLPRGASACQGMPGQAGASQGRRRRRGPDRRDERCGAFCWCANLRVPTARLANLGSRAHDTTDGLPGLPPLSDPAMPVKDPTRSLSCHFHRAAPSVSGLGRPSSTTTVHLHVPPATARSRPWPVAVASQEGEMLCLDFLMETCARWALSQAEHKDPALAWSRRHPPALIARGPSR